MFTSENSDRALLKTNGLYCSGVSEDCAVSGNANTIPELHPIRESKRSAACFSQSFALSPGPLPAVRHEFAEGFAFHLRAWAALGIVMTRGCGKSAPTLTMNCDF
jgi:hypothetical protein